MSFKSENGFTLIELLVVITILSILAVITVSTVLNTLNESKNKAIVDNYSYRFNKFIKEKIVTEEQMDCYQFDGTYYCNQDDIKKFVIKDDIFKDIKAQYIIKNNKIIFESVSMDSEISTYRIEKDLMDSNTKIFKVSDYGGKVNDGKDDTEAIKKAAEKLKENGGGILYFDKGEYNVSIEDEFPIVKGAKQYTYYYQSGYTYNTIVDFKNIEGNIIIDLNNAIIKLKRNSMPGYKMFLIYHCDNVVIKNGTLLGDRETHDYALHEEAGSLSQYISHHSWGHGIGISNSNVIINNIKIKNFTGDGIAISDNPVNTSVLSLNDVELSHCRRNGLTLQSILSFNANNLYIHHVGDYDNINGINPKAGIDIEGEGNNKEIPAKNINFNNLRIDNTTAFAIVSGKKEFTENFYINNSNLTGRVSFYNAIVDNSIFKCSSTSQSSFHHVKATNSKFYLEKHQSTLAFTNNSLIDNCTLEGEYSASTGNYLRIQSGSIIKNSHISKFQGYYLLTNKDGSTRVIRHSKNLTGIKIDDNASLHWENNIFDDCYFVLDAAVEDGKTEYLNTMNNNTIKNSTLWFWSSSKNTARNVYFNNMKFYNTIIDANGAYMKNYVTLNINNSEFVDSIFDKANQNVSNSKIELSSLNRKLHYYSSSNITTGTYDNSTIRILDNLSSKNNFSYAKFINNSKIILDNYNSGVPIINNNSILNQDYIVLYNGKNYLKN